MLSTRGRMALNILNAPFLLPLLGGLIFVCVFHWAYSSIPDSYYQVRDDGVILMSHSRNLVDYGFIGVNPSGGRVEGYSAPVQFFLFATAYALTGTGYAAYAAAQTVVATFLLGALFVLFFEERKIPALLLTALAALFLAYLRPFLEWHGSGMENAVTHVLFLATVLILVSQVRTERILYLLSIPVFLASISRIESIYHIGPLLVIFGVFWRFAFRNWGGMCFSFIVLGLWVLFQWWRYLYFGDFLPNTTYAQSISVFENLRPWLRLDVEHMHHALVRAIKLLEFHGGEVLLLALSFTLVLSRRRQTALLLLLLGSLTLTAAFSWTVFGLPRLDTARLTTHLAVFAALGTAAMFYCLYLDGTPRKRWVATALVMIQVTVFTRDVIAPYKLCCPVTNFESVRTEFARIAEAEALPRPMVSNPDLGAVSWHKQFNIIDLGLLGSPIMAKSLGPLRADYFFNYAAPDIIESHDIWSCLYDGELFSDPRFVQFYQSVATRVLDWYLRVNCKSNLEPLDGFWIRSDILKSSESAERQLIDRVAMNLSVDLLREELEHCQVQSGEAYDCAYVARTAYRFLPEFREQGQVDTLDEIFAASRTVAFDRYLINGYRDGQAYRDAIEFIGVSYVNQFKNSQPIIRSNYDVYLIENSLIYVKEQCGPEDTGPMFFLHLYPVDMNDLPNHRKQYGFDNLGFAFRDHRIPIEGEVCVAIRDLPDYAIAAIRTGQFVPGEDRIWNGSFKVVELADDRKAAP